MNEVETLLNAIATTPAKALRIDELSMFQVPQGSTRTGLDGKLITPGTYLTVRVEVMIPIETER